MLRGLARPGRVAASSSGRQPLCCIAASRQPASARPVEEQALQRLAAPVLAGLLLTSSLSPAAFAAEAYSQPRPHLGAVPDAEAAAQAYDDYLVTPELRDFLKMAEKGSYKMQDLEKARLKLGFKRGLDGRISLRTRAGQWYNIKPDMQAPGFMLLRAEEDGTCFYLPADDGGRLVQIDLSDDLVVAQLYSNGAWQDVMQPLEAETSQGRVEALRMTGAEFRDTVSLLEDAEEVGEQ